jgi:hypothetical protein
MSERLDLLNLAGQPGFNMAELRRRFGVSRETGTNGWSGFGRKVPPGSRTGRDDRRSRRGGRWPRSRRRVWRGIGRTLCAAGERSGGSFARGTSAAGLPAASTITGILCRGGLLERQTPVPKPFKRFEAEACEDECEATVRERLQRLFEAHGLPNAMLTDNGNPLILKLGSQQNGPTRPDQALGLANPPRHQTPVEPPHRAEQGDTPRPWASSSAFIAR